MHGIAEPALENPHIHNRDVHFRLYATAAGPAAVCVQSFDYFDYEPERFLTTDAYDDELAANAALNALLSDLAQADPAESAVAVRLSSADLPLTRRQALLRHLAHAPQVLDSATLLDLVGGYIGHVARTGYPTIAATLADVRRLREYATHASLTVEDARTLAAQIETLAQPAAAT